MRYRKHLLDDPGTATNKMTTLPFRDHLAEVFTSAGVKRSYVDVILRNEPEFVKAFTSKSFDVNKNYEIYEHLGDSIANSIISWYFFRRFPQLDCIGGLKVLARLKINFVSKRSFADISERLGFWPYVRASDEEKELSREALLGDILESFVAATVRTLDDEFAIGVGFAVAYDIVSRALDGVDVSLEHEQLVDAKSRLKELFDEHKSLGRVVYEDLPIVSIVYRVAPNGSRVKIGQGGGRTKADRQKAAAMEGLETLKREGFERRVPLTLFCEN